MGQRMIFFFELSGHIAGFTATNDSFVNHHHWHNFSSTAGQKAFLGNKKIITCQIFSSTLNPASLARSITVFLVIP